MTKTCENCKFFVPVTDHRLFDGTCHNMRATLGAVIQTSRGSTCSSFESLGEDMPGIRAALGNAP